MVLKTPDHPKQASAGASTAGPPTTAVVTVQRFGLVQAVLLKYSIPAIPGQLATAAHHVPSEEKIIPKKVARRVERESSSRTEVEPENL